MIGEHPEASALTEAELGGKFAVSRTVIREAVKTLAAKGLVTARPRYGIIVQPVQCSSLFDAEIFDWLLKRDRALELLKQLSHLRAGIEPEAAALAARNADSVDRSHIQKALTCMCAADGAGERADAEIDFHIAILKATGNPLFSHFRDVVATALRTSLRLANQVKGKPYASSLDDHACVSEAIAAGEPEAARRTMLVLINGVLAEVASRDTLPQPYVEALTSVTRPDFPHAEASQDNHIGEGP